MNTALTPELIQGAISIEQGDGFLHPWRTPYKQKELFPSINDGLLNQMAKPVGVRLRFTSTSSSVTLSLVPSTVDRTFDLVIENEIITTTTLLKGDSAISFCDLPGYSTPVEIWLGYNDDAKLTGLTGDGIAPAKDTRAKWLTYGSSITQCGAATSPARSWPATAARRHDLNLTCLGFGGQCHLDSMIARYIRDRQVDILTLKLGINIMGAASLSPRTFRGAVIGFVQIIREKHPDIPIGIVSPIISPPRETDPNAVGFSLSAMREELMDAVDRIQRVTGDKKIFYFDGLKLFGADLVDSYLPDHLHPNGDGYELMGQNAAEQILPTLLAELV